MTIGLVFLTAHDGRHRVVAVPPDDQRAAVAGAAGGPDVRGGAAVRPAVKTALWVFLGVATSLFVLFVSAYAMRLSFADWTPLPRPRLLMLNTALLVGASLAMEWTVYAARRADRDNVRRGLWASGLLTFGFLAGQLFVWKQFSDAGYFVSTSAATALFLPVHRGARPACARRPRGMGPRIGQGVARQRTRPGSGSASNCARPTGISCSPSGWCCMRCSCRKTSGWRSARRRRCDRPFAQSKEPNLMTTHEATGTTGALPRPAAGKASSRTCPRISAPSRACRGASR